MDFKGCHHQFPPPEDPRHEVWVEALQVRPNNHLNTRVCSMHFDESCYKKRNIGVDGKPYKRQRSLFRKLKETAIPNRRLPAKRPGSFTLAEAHVNHDYCKLCGPSEHESLEKAKIQIIELTREVSGLRQKNEKLKEKNMTLEADLGRAKKRIKEVKRAKEQEATRVLSPFFTSAQISAYKRGEWTGSKCATTWGDEDVECARPWYDMGPSIYKAVNQFIPLMSRRTFAIKDRQLKNREDRDETMDTGTESDDNDGDDNVDRENQDPEPTASTSANANEEGGQARKNVKPEQPDPDLFEVVGEGNSSHMIEIKINEDDILNDLLA